MGREEEEGTLRKDCDGKEGREANGWTGGRGSRKEARVERAAQ